MPYSNINAFAQGGTTHSVGVGPQSKKVVWHQFGAGEPMVLLHGGHGSFLHWVRNIEPLSARYQLLVPDMPGYGDSDSPSENSLAALVDLTLDSLNVLVPSATEITLVGFSFGALAAVEVARRRGGIRRLVLLGPAGHSGRRRPRAELVNWRFADRSGDLEGLRAAMTHNLLSHMLNAPDSIDELALAVHTQSCRKTRFYSRTISRSAGLFEALESVDCPITFVWGEHDVTAEPFLLKQQIAEKNPQRTVHVIPEAGHWVQFEAAREVNSLLLNLPAAPNAV